MVGVSASVNLPLHHKVQKFSAGTGSPGWSRKKGHKMVVVVLAVNGLLLRLFIIDAVVSVMKAVLEKTLEDVKRGEEQERDSYTLMRLSQRRQVVEQKLTGVRQQLAESSKVATVNECSVALHLYYFPLTGFVMLVMAWRWCR